MSKVTPASNAEEEKAVAMLRVQTKFKKEFINQTEVKDPDTARESQADKDENDFMVSKNKGF